MKKLFSVIIAVTIMFSSFVAVRSENETPPIIDDSSLQIITVLLDGEPIKFDDVAPVIVGDHTLVPFRAIFEALGYNVSWNEEDQNIYAGIDGRLVLMRIQVNTAYVSNHNRYLTPGTAEVVVVGDDPFPSPEDFFDVKVELDVPPQIIGDRTFVPVRAVAELSHYDVQWDEKTYTVIITTTENTPTKGNSSDSSK